MDRPRRLQLLLLLALAALVGCDQGFTDPSRAFGPPIAADAPLHPVTVHQPESLGVLDTELQDIHGTPIGIACATCHGAGADTEAVVASLGNPERMHGSVEVRHGPLSCGSCHDTQRDLLHLADGTTLEMADAITLCTQCHGTQRRDYEAGAHGGMQGYWDRRQGPRTRNHCLDCHAAHAPTYVGGSAVHPPRDRFLGQGAAGDTHHD